MTTLFDQNNNDFDPNKSYLEDLVGEGKKFKDLEALARGKAESDAFVKRLEAEQAELRKEYLALREEHNAVPKLQELLDQLEQQRLASSNTNPNANEDINKPAIDMEEVKSLFKAEYENTKRQEQEEANFSKSLTKLRDRYGEDYQTYLRDQSKQLGMSEEEVNRMARSNPEAFGRLFAPTVRNETFEAPPGSSMRNDSFAPKTEKRNWSYYEKLKKEDPAKYWTGKIQNQIIKDMETLGDAFDS